MKKGSSNVLHTKKKKYFKNYSLKDSLGNLKWFLFGGKTPFWNRIATFSPSGTSTNIHLTSKKWLVKVSDEDDRGLVGMPAH